MLGVATSARAGTKEELIRLQADVLALKNQIIQLEKGFTERTDAIRSLVVQLNDQVGKSSLLLGRLSTALENQPQPDTTSLQTVLKEIKDLSSKMDDANVRISALAQQVADMKVQSKPLPQRGFQAMADSPDPSAVSADQIFNEASVDLIQGNLDLAIQGFNAFLKAFPTHERADDAQYGIGEAFYNAKRYPEAISAFTRVITDYSTGGKAASALFKRAKAELELQQKDAAAADFKALIAKFPSAPEASLAREELGKLGVNLKAAKPVVKKSP
jgi:tol-pal system protein YbgF